MPGNLSLSYLNTIIWFKEKRNRPGDIKATHWDRDSIRIFMTLIDDDTSWMLELRLS